MRKKFKSAVVFVHGLGKKPSPEKLREIWLWAIERNEPKPDIFGYRNSGINLDDQGIACFFTYWADVFYGSDYETDYQDQYERANEAFIGTENPEALVGKLKEPEPNTPHEIQFINNLQLKLDAKMAEELITVEDDDLITNPFATQTGGLEIASWLPPPLKQAIIRKAAIEAYYYLFNKEYQRSDGISFQVRRELRNRLLTDLHAAKETAEKVIIVSHSMGTMLAYDVLRNVADCPHIDTLFTLGSPLGISEIQDELRADGTKNADFPAARLLRWVNVFDPKDLICGLSPYFAREYLPVDGKIVEDINESNWGAWRHTATHYLAGIKFRTELAASLEIDLS